MIITSKYTFPNPKLNEVINIMRNTQLVADQKYGYNYFTEFDIKSNTVFLDKTTR